MNIQTHYDNLVKNNPDLKYLCKSDSFKLLIQTAIEEERQNTLDQILGDSKTNWADLQALKIQHQIEKSLLSQFLSLTHEE